jgi:hypothetical protein
MNQLELSLLRRPKILLLLFCCLFQLIILKAQSPKSIENITDSKGQSLQIGTVYALSKTAGKYQLEIN